MLGPERCAVQYREYLCDLFAGHFGHDRPEEHYDSLRDTYFDGVGGIRGPLRESAHAE